MGKSSAPPAPDYAAAAQQQGVANKETAITNNAVNRVNQYTPDGSSTWSLRAGADPANPQVGDYNQTVTMSPEQQKLASGNNAINQSLLDVGQNQLGKVANSFNNPTVGQGLTGWQSAPTAGGAGANTYANKMATVTPGSVVANAGKAGGAPQVTNAVAATGIPAGGGGGGGKPGPAPEATAGGDTGQALTQGSASTMPQGAGKAGSAPAPQDAASQAMAVMGYGGGSLNPAAGGGKAGSAPAATAQTGGGGQTGGSMSGSGNPSFGAPNDYEASRNAVTNSLMSRLDSSYAKDQSALRSQLLNSGVEPGTDAYNRQMESLGQTNNDARMQAVLAGGQEQTRLNELSNANQTQNNQNNTANSNIDLANKGFNYNTGLSSATFNNQTRQQQLQEQAYFQNLDLNNLNALRTGTQATGPSFGSYYTNNAQAAPVYQAASDLGNYNSAAASQSQSGSNATMGAIGTVAGAALMAF